MNPTLDEQLVNKYPKIFANRYASPDKTAMCWGFECGDGWYDLIDHLCSEIQWHLDKNAKAGTTQFVALQVKEKFGTLRFYGEGGDEKIRNMIWFAEGFSGKLCEQCGKPGTQTRGGWIRTLCNEHKGDNDD